MAAYRKVALEGFFRVSIIDSLYQELIGELERTGLTFGVRECSERYGVAVGASVIEGMRSDGLATLPADSGYVPPVGPGYWMPAPPFFERPENPHWGRIRPLALDSVRQIKVMPPLAFSADTTSAMARAAIELIDSTREPDPDRVHAAVFWLDMPVPTMRGDPMRKSRPSMSPPAHWISIANTALVHAGSSLSAALEVYALTSIAMHDAAVVTWAEKYRLNLLRPMQYVNTVLMREWMAGIPNPPTPEFPSDRAAIAGAAGTVLTTYLGDHALVDSTEAAYGLGVRSFESVTDAAREAAVSGFYGGIQFRQSGDAGLALGRDVARAALQRIQPPVTRSPAKNGQRR
jgi:hypothetical protein